MRYFLTRFLILSVVIFGTIEIAVRAVASNRDEAAELIPIQSPNHLIPVLRQIQRFEQSASEDAYTTYALIGDSLWYGETMKNHGDDNWRAHTLDRQLTALSKNSKVRYINLGLDGLLPAEILSLSTAAKALGADGVIADVGLRSVSADFNAPNDHTREWLRNFTVSPKRRLGWTTTRTDILHRVALKVNVLISEYSYSYNALKRARMKYFNDAPAGFTSERFKAVNAWLAGETGKKTESASARSFALLKARARYKTVSFDPAKSDQAKSIMALARLADQKFSVTLVYAQEDKAELSKVVDLNVAAAQKADLANRLASLISDSKTLTYISEIKELDDRDFLDLVHVDQAGYTAYAKEIQRALGDSEQ